MMVLFWLCLAQVTYTYFGYVMLLWLVVQLNRRSILGGTITPPVSIIIAARNEESTLPAKLANINLLEYPKEKLQVIVVSDGSTDHTSSILSEHGSVESIILDKSGGKALALNEAVKHATGEILVFLDSRQSVDVDALNELVWCFADPSVGAASGELLLESNSTGGTSDGLGVYWKLEKAVRKLESESGSVVGVTGAIYAMRRELFTQIPSGTILDDVFVPMYVALRGKRVVFQPSAIARDRIFSDKGKEFSRKVRTLTGNYQLLRTESWLLSSANPLLFRFISHKLLRLVVPLSLVVMLATSGLSRGAFCRVAVCLQLLFYAVAALGVVSPSAKKYKPVAVASTFVMLNIAAAVAFFNFLSGRNRVWI
jgi:biofilm PGA synthesis N-glycosyltransferase PgaC